MQTRNSIFYGAIAHMDDHLANVNAAFAIPQNDVRAIKHLMSQHQKHPE